MGPKNAPGTFQATMKEVLATILFASVAVYLDEMCRYFLSEKQHLNDWRKTVYASTRVTN